MTYPKYLDTPSSTLLNAKQIGEISSATFKGGTSAHLSKDNSNPLSRHVGSSNYSEKKIQPWHIWDEYNLNPWDADIIKRILRTKVVDGQSEIETRKEDYQKVIHICEFLISRLEKRNDAK